MTPLLKVQNCCSRTHEEDQVQLHVHAVSSTRGPDRESSISLTRIKRVLKPSTRSKLATGIDIFVFFPINTEQYFLSENSKELFIHYNIPVLKLLKVSGIII